MNSKEQKPTILNYYALAAFFSSIVLGIAYITLFLWKEIGISHLIYYAILFTLAVIPVFVTEKAQAKTKFSNWLILLPASLAASFLFVYRLNPGWVTFAFLSLPVLYGFLLRAVFISSTAKSFNILSFLVLPILFVASWFADIGKFVRNLRFKVIKTNGVGTVVKRVVTGILVAAPFLLFFGVLLSSADAKFGKELGIFFEKIFGDWFTDDLISNLGKLFVGFLVSIYSMIYYFSLWNPESNLAKMMNKNNNRELKEAKRKWNAISVSVFLFALNLLFLAFVAFQFKYLFGGDDNIFKEEGFTYSQYARKGFGELSVVALSAYLVMLVINSKALIQKEAENIIYRANYIILAVCILIVTYSAFARLALYQQMYGYTELRLFASTGIVSIAILYVMLILSTFMKRPLKFTNTIICVLAVAFYLFWIMLPQDYAVAKLNYLRYKNTEKIDVPYLLGLSDEAIPVLIEMGEDPEVSQSIQILIYSELEDRWEDVKDSRKNWQSWNLIYEYNRKRLAEINESAWSDKAREQLQTFLDGYEEAVLTGQFEYAYENYWTKHSVPLDLSELEQFTITKYEFEGVPEFDDWAILGDSGTEYWMGMEIAADIEYNYLDDGSMCDNRGYTSREMCDEYKLRCGEDTEAVSDNSSGVFFTYDSDTGSFTAMNDPDSSESCQIRVSAKERDYVRVVLENGEWRIKDSSLMTLGNFRDGNSGRVLDENKYFEQNVDFSPMRH
ncbi:DUF4173 domain-containing protein [Candidatus Dojkabacteria bacterium]|nr:DUF4173 domain-containing protein [Candidatus Dojkabacteria bacterium]